MRGAGTVVLVAGITAAALAPRVTAQAGNACDKACLTGIADRYFAAMAAHDPSKAPMAPKAKFTEQTKVLAVGEGLWKTMSEAPTTFKIYVPDPVSGQLGAIAVICWGQVVYRNFFHSLTPPPDQVAKSVCAATGGRE